MRYEYEILYVRIVINKKEVKKIWIVSNMLYIYKYYWFYRTFDFIPFSRSKEKSD